MQHKMDQSIDEKHKQLIYDSLTNLGVCLRCILRFSGYHTDKDLTLYKRPEDFFSKFKVDAKNEEENMNSKKVKKNPCLVCLNCLEGSMFEKIAEKVRATNICDYKYDNFSISVSFPKTVMLRAYSVYLFLKEQFPEIPLVSFSNSTKDVCLEQPSRIFRISASGAIGSVIGKKYHPASPLSINITLGYTNDEHEIEKAVKLDGSKHVSTKKNHRLKGRINNAPVLSRNNLVDILTEDKEKLFRENFDIPASIPNEEVFVEDVTIDAEPIYLGGRYLKFSRNIGQTPWVINGKRMTEHSVEEIMFEAISKIIGVNKTQLSFAASGREDADARMVGSGRPFYIKISNPKVTQIPFEMFRAVEKEIIASKMVALIKLQKVNGTNIESIKHGEENKTKTYTALCHTIAPDTDAAIEKINSNYNKTSLQIVQNTPMRVLHRRTLMKRNREILMMYATKVPDYPGLFELILKTQAGTYVKEFVNGDFDRTIPNISSIIGYPTDVVALDVSEINLDWPDSKEKNYSLSDKVSQG